MSIKGVAELVLEFENISAVWLQRCESTHWSDGDREYCRGKGRAYQEAADLLRFSVLLPHQIDRKATP